MSKDLINKVPAKDAKKVIATIAVTSIVAGAYALAKKGIEVIKVILTKK